MKIAVVGTGYVGLVSGACFAEMGNNVTCVDIDKKKIENLKNGVIPIYEPGLEDMVKKNAREGRLRFTTDLPSVMDGLEILFCAVGTPPAQDGSADLSYVMGLASEIGQCMTGYLLVVTKSTVPVGTSMKVKEAIRRELDKRGTDIEFDVASNPEFLKEGNAVKDFMSPDRVVVGIESEKARKILTRLYKPFLINNFRVMFMDIASSEMTKYASNAMLATRISFMNDIANLSERVGADITQVRAGMGGDGRIGNKFLYAGIGYGGSCFPKDIRALIKTGEENGVEMTVLKAVEKVNDRQKSVLYNKFLKHYSGDIADKKVAVWGLAFKPETDDMRDAPSLDIINALLTSGCQITAYDPIAVKTSQKIFADKAITYAKDMYESVNGADVLMLLTEWKQFRMPDWNDIKKRMRTPYILDGRNIYEKDYLTSLGFCYEGIGR